MAKKTQSTGSGFLRVIAGSYRGRKLRTLPGPDTRPTSDRLRETLFNIVSPWIQGSVFLDLCAGSGAIGIEALSRGASRAVFVEKSRAAGSLIGGNLNHIGAQLGAVLTQDALTALRLLGARHEKFNVIYFDPPYDGDLYEPVLVELGSGSLLSDNGILIVEHQSRVSMPDNRDRLVKYRELRQGNSALTFYRSDASEAPLQADGQVLGGDDTEPELDEEREEDCQPSIQPSP